MSEVLWQRRRVVVLALILALFASPFSALTRPQVASAASVASILVVTNPASSNPFSGYVGEILAAEGFDDVEVRPISDLNSALLTGRSVVILGESSPSGAQISALNGYVSAGGGLIAMRPVAGLNTVLGVTTSGGTTAEGYLRITDGTIGAGLYSDTMQFHGTASHYGLQPGTTQVAELYTTRVSSAGIPVVTIATFGSGRAAMFAYDLGRSVVLTRQGNPANANTDTDGDGVVRTIDLYRNWTDLERSSVPQADVQGRLLARLIEAVSPQPTPRLWFFPGTAPTVLVATGDAHANPDSYFQTEITQLSQQATEATFYLTQSAAPSVANVAAWRSQGYDFSIHPYVDCGYACGIDATRNWFQNRFGVTPRTIRTHQVRWFGWADAASIEASRGLAMDFNSYQWGPWVSNSNGPALGYLNGGGLPLRFADANGTILPIYQQHTSLVDEFLAPNAGLFGLNLSQAVAASQATIDAAIDAYHVPVATQFHVDYFFPSNSTWALQTSAYALSRGAVSMTADDWLNFVLERDATTMSNSSWIGNTLTFDVGAGGGNQTMLLPLQHRGNSLTEITRNGSPVSYTTLAINGSSYAAVGVSSGSYAVTFAADTTAPAVTEFSPADGATDVPVTSPVSVTFSETMQQSATQAAFSINPSTAGAFSWNGAGTVMTFTPSAPLADSTQFSIAISNAASDLAGNPLSAVSWSFTTAEVTSPPAVTGVSPSSGPLTGGTVVTISGTDLTGASAVRFGNLNATSFTVVNSTTITATTPAHAAGAVHVTVTTATGTSPSVAADQFTFVDVSAEMTIVAVDPGAASSSGGATISIAGSGFLSGAVVTIAGSPATNVNVVSTTRITATVPAHAAGSVNVVVTDTGGGSATLANGFTYIACPGFCVTETTSATLAAGTTGSTTAVVETSDGEISLAPEAAAEFSGSQIPSGWSVSPWTTGGGATVSGGTLSLDAALLGTGSLSSPGRAVEFVATFSNSPHQHIGFGTNLNNTPWAIFSTGPSGGALFARTSGGADTQINGSWLGSPHRYRIEWTNSGVIYFIDGVQVATHAVAINGGMRPVASDGPLGGAALTIDWFRMSPYQGSGSYLSRMIDSGGAAAWDTIAWTAELPNGTSLNLSVRTGNTPAPDGSWSAFMPVSGPVAGLSLNGRYLQYRADLTTSNVNVTPSLRDVTIAYRVTGTPGPTITSIVPSSGPVSGGTSVTIAGANFATGATVTVGGSAATNVVVSETTITLNTPAHAAGVVDVVVTNPDSQSGMLAGGYTYVAGQPAIANVTPNAGPTTGGTEVTVSGSNFSGATAVTFGSAPATSFTVVSATQITAVAPAQAAGAVDVRVTTAGGTSPVVTADQFTYVSLVAAPAVSSVDPGSGPTSGGATVEISGTNFGPGMTVRFNGAAATSLTVISSSTLTATVPPGTAGVVNVTVQNPAGQQNTLVGGYTYVDCSNACVSDTTDANFSAGAPDSAASVTTVADGEVRLAPTLGTDFSGTVLPDGWFGGPWTTSGTFTVEGGQVSVNSAAIVTGTFFTSGRTIEFDATFGNGAFQHAGLGIDLNGAPWLIFSTGSAGTGLYARSNSNLPATDTLISGDWLGTAHRYRIDWGGTSATFFIDGQQVAQHSISIPGSMRPIISDAPAGGAVLSVDWLRVSPYAGASVFESRIFDAGAAVDWDTIGWSADLPAGTSVTLSVRSGNTPVPDGTWTAFSPVTANGTELTISGQFMQYRANLTSTSPNVTPALRDVTVSYTSDSAAPIVSSISPSSGPASGATIVTITGSGFSGASSVAFGGGTASFSVVSDTEIQATSPAHAAGSVDIIVTTAAGASGATPQSSFTYTMPTVPPDVTAVSPTSGSTLGGTTITVTGSGFVNGARIVVGGVDATNVAFTSATTLTGTTPPRSAGTVSVQVINPGGLSDTLASAFTYVVIASPSVTSVSPNEGSTSGGSVLTIAGTSFTSGAAVVIGGVPATNVVFVSATSLRATTPAHAAGLVSVTVTNPSNQTGTRANAFRYVAPVTAAAAAASSVSIQNGSVSSGNAGSLATNNGSYLTVASAQQGSNRIVSFYGQYVVPSARRTIVELTIDYDGGATAAGYNRTISLYNFDTGAWEVLRTEAQTTSDLRTTITITDDPSRFMASNGRLRMRIQAIRPGNSTFSLRGDLMTFTVTYLP